MLLLGFQFDLQDVLQVIVGIALGLLTVYRRELSCNRGYHPEDENDDDDDDVTWGPGDYGAHDDRGSRNNDGNGRNSSGSRPMRRRKSSSALPDVTAFQEEEDEQQRLRYRHRRRHRNANGNSGEDPTEELLESAGLFLSGGPFLAAAIAVFEHVFFRTLHSAKLLLANKINSVADSYSSHGSMSPREEEDDMLVSSRSRSFSQSSGDGDDGATRQQQQQQQQQPLQSQHLYSVAWNAATEYYTSISAKLDTTALIPRRDASTMHRRFKSTGNLQQHLVSNERARTLLWDMMAMANRGGMDVALLPSDAQILVFSHLYPKDVLAFACTNRAGRDLLEDEVSAGDGDADSGASTTEDGGGGEEDDEGEDASVRVDESGDNTALLIWKALFRRDYSWVLTDWKIGREAFLRSAAPCREDRESLSWALSDEVLRHVTSVVLGTESDPRDEGPPPADRRRRCSSMKEFYFTFVETWLNYTIAGCNSPDKCLIGLHGHVFDISHFVEDHPGSTETLLLQSGRDATVFFEGMGHSLGARKVATGMCAVIDGNAARWQLASEEGENNDPNYQMRPGPMGPLYHTWGLTKPSCRSMDVKRNMVGFLIPTRRAKPRFRGGLRRVRERIEREEVAQLRDAARWGRDSVGPDGMFGGIQVYYDPFRGWRWWYTDRDFNAVFTAPAPS